MSNMNHSDDARFYFTFHLILLGMIWIASTIGDWRTHARTLKIIGSIIWLAIIGLLAAVWVFGL